MSNVVFDAIICGIFAVGAALATAGINRNADAIDDILVAILNNKEA